VRRTDRYRFYIVLLVLVALQLLFAAGSGDDRVAPDFLLLALLIYSIRAQPGKGAAAGFIVGLLRDALTPASFGAAPGPHAGGLPLRLGQGGVLRREPVRERLPAVRRDVVPQPRIGAGVGAAQGRMLGWELLVWSPLQSLTTSLVGMLVLWMFKRTMSMRLSDA